MTAKQTVTVVNRVRFVRKTAPVRTVLVVGDAPAEFALVSLPIYDSTGGLLKVAILASLNIQVTTLNNGTLLLPTDGNNFDVQLADSSVIQVPLVAA